MKNKLIRIAVLAMLPMMWSCSDNYPYDDGEPTWLGDNIYDYLEHKGEYSTYLALAEALDYKEILQRTGSKTLFPATDKAYKKLLGSMGITGTGEEAVSQMSPSMKRYLFNASMLNMAYLDNMLSNVSASDNQTGEGVALRRESAYSNLDSVQYWSANRLPDNTFWARFQDDNRGIYLADNGVRYSVYYTPSFLHSAGVTSLDWEYMTKGQDMPWSGNDVYVNNSRLLRENLNITCKNGYLHAAENVVLPLKNMAECIEANEKTTLFAHLMDKFCAPYYNSTTDEAVHSFYAYGDGEGIADSVFVRRFFNDTDCTVDPTGQLDVVNNYGTLYYDPSANTWQSMTEMGAMFVPTDAALEAYWNSSLGKFLRDQYASWDAVPTDVLSLFIKNHQRRSLLSSLPHAWNVMTDESSFYMNMSTDDVNEVETACNGIVFVMDQVYPPVDYRCVYAPTLVSDSTTVMRAAIQDGYMLFYLYLRSMENQYNLLVPTDEAMRYYRDPISWAIWANTGVDNREIWSFRLVNGVPVADVYGVNEDGSRGPRKNTLDGSTSSDALNRLRNRLNDLLDMLIVVADNDAEVLSGFFDSGTMQYGLTKGGTVVAVEGSGSDIVLRGAGNPVIEGSDEPARVVTLADGVPAMYETGNGHTFFINHVPDDPFRSVYTTLQSKPEYEAFFNLCVGEPTVFSALKDEKDVEPIFDQQQGTSTTGIGPVVTSFNNFRYTLLVPTAEAIEQAFHDDPNLWTWERIDAESNYDLKKTKTQYLLNFIRCHFLDGIVPIAGTTIENREYETAARDATNHFVRVRLTTHGDDLTVSTEDGRSSCSVTSEPALRNVFTRDIIVNNADYTKASQISASSRAVIHLVDKALNYQNPK